MSEPALVPFELQLIAGLVLFSFLLWVAYLIRGQRLGLRESLLWLVSTLLALVLVVFPKVLRAGAVAVGVRVPSNALFALGFVYVLSNLLSLTIAISRNASRTRRLSQECAILRAEVEQIRTRVEPSSGIRGQE